jgi:polysaccharide pyruvyl transferase WcaK-like protein
VRSRAAGGRRERARPIEEEEGPAAVPPGPRIGLWGTFDLENYGDMLFPRIVEEELGRRLPEAHIRVFAPIGYTGLNRFEEREPAESLGSWSPDRVAELAGELDCVVVGPGEIIHTRDELLSPHYGLAPVELRARAPSRFFIAGLGPELESECPVVWSAVGIPFDFKAREAARVREALADRPLVAVRDDVSLRRLRAAGVSREVEVVPDPAFLSPRVFASRLLQKRLAQLRVSTGFPEEAPLVVQGNAGSLPHVPALAAALSRLREERDLAGVVIVETGPCHGDGEFAQALAKALPGSVRLPPGGLADVTAAIASSAGFIGTSLHGNITALGYDRPHLVLAWGGETKLEGFAAAIDNPDCLVERADDIPGAFEKAASLGSRADVVADLQGRVDAHLDRVAEVAAKGHAPRTPAPAEVTLAEHVVALRRAYERRGRMLVAQRWTLADRLADLDAEIAALGEEIARLKREVAGRKGELERLLNTKTFRYTAALRNLYGRLRRSR